MNFALVFVFVNMGQFQTACHMKVHTRYIPKIHIYTNAGSLPKLLKELSNLKFELLAILLFFLGRKNCDII